MDISTYLHNILTISDGEDVCDNITPCASVLNTDELVDISTEKAIIQTHPVGKTIRKAIARMLEKLANYTPNKKIVFVSQDEYDDISNPDENTLYLIRKPDKCFVVSLDENGEYNPFGEVWSAFNEGFWSLLEYYLRENSGPGEPFYNEKYLALYVGNEFNVTSIATEFFMESKLVKADIDLASFTVGDRAFFNSDRLKEVRFGSGLTSMGSNVFIGCSNLKIMIDKAEDSIPGAPWGATNTTVIWTG